jgi:death-on-curing protein
LETNQTIYFSYPEAVLIHFELMWLWGESRYGVFDAPLLKSALARPEQAAAYEDADIIRQAATLCFGLVKNHPWVGGNKRTATALTRIFLRRNGVQYRASIDETIKFVHYIESDLWKVSIEIKKNNFPINHGAHGEHGGGGN